MDAPSPPIPPFRVIYGFPEEWADFHTRNLEFLNRFGNLEKTIHLAFDRIHENTELWQRTVYFLGRLGVEEFMEILLLCGNGYGIGAQKLIRGMYERAVTTNYLCNHPDEATDFQAYERVADYKFLQSVRACGGGMVISGEQAAEIERDYQSVKERFLVTNCKKCHTTRVNHSWNKKDLVSMARESDGLWALLPHAYLQPTRQLHSTMGSIFSRLDAEELKNGAGLMFDSDAQREKADLALRVAHLILLSILSIPKECFHIAEVEPLLQICLADFSQIYRGKDEKAGQP